MSDEYDKAFAEHSAEVAARIAARPPSVGMTPAAVRRFLRELGGHNLGEVTTTMVEELLLYPGACDTRHQLTVLQALLRVHATLITDDTAHCLVCGSLLATSSNEALYGKSLGHRDDCPLDIGP